MLKKLYPTAYYKSVFNIPLSVLKKKGVKGLIFDIDNTLSAFDLPEPDEEIISFIQTALSEGFLVCLLSNNSKKRVTLYNKKLNIHAVYRANKPFGSGLRRAMSLIGTTHKNTVLIGDQIFTDILCGNIAGVRTILVSPCSEKDYWMTKPKRNLERKILNKYLEGRSKK